MKQPHWILSFAVMIALSPAYTMEFKTYMGITLFNHPAPWTKYDAPSWLDFKLQPKRPATILLEEDEAEQMTHELKDIAAETMCVSWSNIGSDSKPSKALLSYDKRYAAALYPLESIETNDFTTTGVVHIYNMVDGYSFLTIVAMDDSIVNLSWNDLGIIIEQEDKNGDRFLAMITIIETTTFSRRQIALLETFHAFFESDDIDLVLSQRQVAIYWSLPKDCRNLIKKADKFGYILYEIANQDERGQKGRLVRRHSL